MKKTLLITFLTLFTIIPAFVYAQDISVDELLGNDDVDIEEVEQLEEERVESIENELTLSIPEYTDNPSHIITFVDPSEDKEGVEIDIDESGYKEISTPYTLPSLSIGLHTLKFRFIDSLGATKILEYELVVLPRPPIVKAPTFSNNIFNVSGTGLANSEILITISVNASNYTKIVDIDSDGDWSADINLDTVPNGIYTVFAYTRKDGYASNPSEPAVLAYGEDGATTISSYQDSNEDIIFSFSNINIEDIPNIFLSNPDLIIYSIGLLLIGILFTVILSSLFKKNKEDSINKSFSQKFKKKESNEKTLKELFSQEGDKNDSKKNIKKKKVEKVMNKKDFLKDFKNFDPDNAKGKENKEPTKKDKKDVIISLTSQNND
jgi:hypothetical protein